MGRKILTETGAFDVPAGKGLWLDADDARAASGWELKPEGMCRGDVCVPLPAAARNDGAVDLAAFWHLIDAPAVSDTTGTIWSIGASARDRSQALETLEAPDFTLPDLAGTQHRLADLRGNKVLLVTWASW